MAGHHRKTGAIAFDSEAFYQDIIDAIIAGLNEYAEHVARDFRKLLLKRPDGPAGRRTWRKEMQQWVKIEDPVIDEEKVSIKVRINFACSFTLYVE